MLVRIETPNVPQEIYSYSHLEKQSGNIEGKVICVY